jgi:hypothetical protein
VQKQTKTHAKEATRNKDNTAGSRPARWQKVSVSPHQAIKVDQANLEFHEKAAGTFNEELAKSSAPPPPHAH